MTEQQTRQPYIGRFAPSPSGPLHLGSLVAALGSYLQARSQQGRWLLRIEDIDPPREAPGASENIIKTLELYGFEWDGPITYQSQRYAFYEEALSQLKKNHQLYACSCSRQQIAQANPGTRGKIRRYPGTCREKHLTFNNSRQPLSLRMRTENTILRFEDSIQGLIEQNIFQQSGDIILLRRDGYYAYLLAVSIDDMQQNVTEVVRGRDLLETTVSQLAIIQQLGAAPPDYAHLPVVTLSTGEKLSKQTGATPLPLNHPVTQLYQALHFLGQSPPADLGNAKLDEFWQWAQQNWRLKSVPKKVTKVPEPAV
ncbi:Glutamyl-Q tRNA(Asp) synthetase [hydrothermal vent metagenome]|uniref:Glutamyl-Q tRNA(Asp) synthetase n=1 Tax=hydrothermal vent metagenome TaxID=652676 RepID=A0A3B1BAY5_9ZZZZ